MTVEHSHRSLDEVSRVRSHSTLCPPPPSQVSDDSSLQCMAYQTSPVTRDNVDAFKNGCLTTLWLPMLCNVGAWLKCSLLTSYFESKPLDYLVTKVGGKFYVAWAGHVLLRRIFKRWHCCRGEDVGVLHLDVKQYIPKSQVFEVA